MPSHLLISLLLIPIIIACICAGVCAYYYWGYSIRTQSRRLTHYRNQHLWEIDDSEQYFEQEISFRKQNNTGTQISFPIHTKSYSNVFCDDKIEQCTDSEIL